MTEEQATALAIELDGLGLSFGPYEISAIVACVRSVLRESKERERSMTWNDWQRAIASQAGVRSGPGGAK
jgi:hypothetical protein